MLSLRSMIHSASLRATGSVIEFLATSATTSFDFRVASITCLTSAMSAAEVALVGATENGPAAGRTSGLKVAFAEFSEPRKPMGAWAKALSPLGSAAACLPAGGANCIGCPAAGPALLAVDGFRISLAACTAALGSVLAAVFAAPWMAGRGRGNGTFWAAAMAVWALKAPAAASPRPRPRRVRKVPYIQSLARISRGSLLAISEADSRPQNRIRPIWLTKGYP